MSLMGHCLYNIQLFNIQILEDHRQSKVRNQTRSYGSTKYEGKRFDKGDRFQFSNGIRERIVWKSNVSGTERNG